MGAEAGSADILALLKSETKSEHDAAESALRFFDPQFSIEDYSKTIRLFFGFYHPLEEQLWHVPGWAEAGLDLEHRRKSVRLESDLRALGISNPHSLPFCSNLPKLDGLGDGFGCLYVLEGATLGGRHISRYLREKLNVLPETTGAFHAGYGERTGAMWSEFREKLTAYADGRDENKKIVDAALATFRSLREWMISRSKQ
jgi:heme oxygenase (biliverdin-IX-beta and delta-forming)